MGNNIERFVEYQNILNSIAFKKLEYVKTGAMLAFPISHLVFNQGKTVLKNIKSIVGQLILDRYGWDVQCHGGKNLIFISHLYLSRKDHIEVMLKIASTTPSYDLAMPIEKRNINVSNFKYLPLVFSWYHQLRKSGFDLSQKLNIISNIFASKRYIDAVQKTVNLENYRTVIVRMDGQVSDNIVAQTAKEKGCITVTAQDGYQVGKFSKADAPWQCQQTLRGSVSDYFIAWSEFFVEAIKQTIDKKEKVVPLGIPKYIHVEESQNGEPKFFGVLLDCSDTENCNTQLIETANYIAKKYNIQYALRYHPRDKNNIYENIADREYCAAHERETDFYSFVKGSKFILGCNSTSILESMFVNKRTYRMYPLQGKDVLSDCAYPCTFSNIEKLCEFIDDDICASDDYSEHICGPKNVFESYAEFFKSLET